VPWKRAESSTLIDSMARIAGDNLFHEGGAAVAQSAGRRYDGWSRVTGFLRMNQWRKLAILIFVALTLVGASVTWSARRHGHAGPAVPVLIPGTVSRQAPR
jgi:hypothetical protein